MTYTGQTLSNNVIKIDTLQTQINHLRHVVDSLNVISTATSIGTGYFHDIIGGTFTSFVGFIAIIATIAGYVSWRAITLRFERERGAMQTNFDERITTMETQFHQALSKVQEQAAKNSDTHNKELNDLKIEAKAIKRANLFADINISRAMSYLNEEKKIFYHALLWALKAIPNYVEIGKTKELTAWISHCESLFNKMDLNGMSEGIKQNANTFKNRLDSSLKVLPEGLKNKIENMKQQILKVIES